MLTLKRPSDEVIRQHLASLVGSPFSYAAVGATTTRAPAGFKSDRHEVRLGYGAETFDIAKTAIREWKMFPPEMATIYWPTPIEVDQIVAVLFPAPLLWSLNPCRIVYTVDEADSKLARFGFAYGTLADHIERGEELFLVEHRLEDDSVWYRLECFSRPQHVIAWLGYPYARQQQAKFRRLSGLAMQRAISG